MNDRPIASVHWSFWVIGVVALLWNVMGVMNFLMQTNPDALSGYPDAARALVESRPAWATGAFAIAVFGGALGCILLLFKKSAAFYLSVASLLGVIVTSIHTISSQVNNSTRLRRSEMLMQVLTRHRQGGRR